MGGLDWIYVAQERTKWWKLVNQVMKIRLLENMGAFHLAEKLLASQGGPRSVQI
jgi:hypothetical protein